MDSAILWESDIQCQVKTAYEQAALRSKLPKEIHFLFQKALRNGKLVRSGLHTEQGIPDLEHAIFQVGTDFFEGRSQKILIVGASAINLKVLAYLKRKGYSDITLCNRSKERGELAADKYNCPLIPWNLRATWKSFDWIIYGTKSPTILLHKEEVGEILGKKCIMDLSVPRNVDPEIGSSATLQVLNIDDLHQIVQKKREGLTHLIRAAESLLFQAVARQRLKSGAARYARERDHVADVLHAGNVL
jgi:glutamyl-tRNA reductase